MISDYAGPGSSVVFDAVKASVVRGERTIPGEEEVVRRVTNAGEDWLFGIEAGGAREFVERFGLRLTDEADASALEARYFGGEAGRVNGTHVIIQAEK